MTETPAGRKDDVNKPRFSLIPTIALHAVIRVLEHGAARYAPDNWRYVDNPKTRYFNAAQRHLLAWWGGERNDPDSGEHHLAHAGCCVLFLIAIELEGETDGK